MHASRDRVPGSRQAAGPHPRRRVRRGPAPLEFTLEGYDRLPGRRPGDPVPEPRELPRLGVPDAHRAAPDQLRRQGRVHGFVEDQVAVPGDGHDPDRPRRRRTSHRPRSTPPRRCCVVASCSGSSPRAPGPATATCTRAAPARPAWPSRSGARSSRSASSAPARSSRPTPRLPKTVPAVHDQDRPADQRRALQQAGRRPPGPAPDHRRADVRDPRADRPGVPERVRRLQGRDRADGAGRGRATSPMHDDATASRRRRRRTSPSLRNLPGRRRAALGRLDGRYG